MTKQKKQAEHDHLTHLAERYLGLESMEVTEVVLELCGASIDMYALPLLRRRQQEEDAQMLQYEAHGYTRMCEKCEQLVASLHALISVLEQMEQEEQV